MRARCSEPAGSALAMQNHDFMTSSARARLVLPADLRARIEQYARRAHPHEACGLLLGRRTDTHTAIVDVREVRNRNTSRAHDRYELDPADHLAAEEDAARLGLHVVGVWHSHPEGPARPSDTDRRAAWPDWSYVIVARTQSAACEVRSWRLVGGTFQEEAVE